MRVRGTQAAGHEILTYGSPSGRFRPSAFRSLSSRSTSRFTISRMNLARRLGPIRASIRPANPPGKRTTVILTSSGGLPSRRRNCATRPFNLKLIKGYPLFSNSCAISYISYRIVCMGAARLHMGRMMEGVAMAREHFACGESPGGISRSALLRGLAVAPVTLPVIASP